MQKNVKSLQQVSQEINEEIGILKNFSAENGYYKVIMENGRDIKSSESKIRAYLRFQGTNPPTSIGYFKSKRGYNGKYKNNKKYANHYGEYIAYIILKQLGKNACKVDIGELQIKNPYSNKVINVEGVLSHFQLSQEETFMPISPVIDTCMKVHLKKYEQMAESEITYSETNYTNIEIILEAIKDYVEKHGQMDKLSDMRKKFFDMCIWDLKFANRDRHDENFGLKINKATNEIEFYHLFDNEQILGMQVDRDDVIKYLKSDDAYQKFKARELTSYIGIPRKCKDITPQVFLTYLLENYYEETMDSLQDIGRYSLEDLEELLECFPKLSLEHKEFAKKIFSERELELTNIVNDFNKRKSKKTRVDEEPVL